jgi:ABC-2 type transport system permease protein
MKRTSQKTTLQKIYSELSVMGKYIRINLAAAAELRISFLMQVGGMIINNVSFVVVWLLFFNAFGTINGWSGKEVIGLQGFLALTFGIAFAFFNGSRDLELFINNGTFDSILLTPKNLYLRILTVTATTSAIGDMIFGILLSGIYAYMAHLSLTQVLLLVSLVPPVATILINFALITSCIGFYMPDSAQLSQDAFEIIFGPSMYPSGMYQGIVRFAFLVVIPSIAVGGLPVEAVANLDIFKVGIVWVLAVAWFLIALFVLRRGVRRYESANLTGARV